MFVVLRKSWSLELPFETRLQLFDNMVKPILTYGAEVWGFEDDTIVESLHLEFCRLLLSYNKHAPRTMIYGELDRFPLSISTKEKLIGYLGKLVSDRKDKISNLMYKVMLNKYLSGEHESLWISSIFFIEYQTFFSLKWIKANILLISKGQYKQSWH